MFLSRVCYLYLCIQFFFFFVATGAYHSFPLVKIIRWIILINDVYLVPMYTSCLLYLNWDKKLIATPLVHHLKDFFPRIWGQSMKSSFWAKALIHQIKSIIRTSNNRKYNRSTHWVYLVLANSVHFCVCVGGWGRFAFSLITMNSFPP